ncbi:hypothetical protein LUZ61_016484 [Rhynchospora tenuis]|uniref:RING-type domain-containing protein n=1 Tax=Rhynchospora tenuis TaxID=198213 RepID=A0AAD5Z5M5_9POAL|nr:hypothetical protein LUZ61_016484 [Rhynchospora tenuis]
MRSHVEREEAVERGKARASLIDRKDSMDEGDSDASHSSDHTDQFLYVKLEEIRKEVQCPICLGIIRKTRTVMECLHRFCRDCIDKSMRMGNNECPACRAHCASRRSLRDDPNFDALISALYPDIDKFEQEELSFNEEENSRNKMVPFYFIYHYYLFGFISIYCQFIHCTLCFEFCISLTLHLHTPWQIQDSIAKTFRRQLKSVGKKSVTKSPAMANVRRSRKRGLCATSDVGPTGADDEDRQEQQDNIEVDALRNRTSSSEEQSLPPEERPRRRKQSRQTARNLQDSLNSSLLIAWGRNGTRSRHANPTVGSNGARVSRVSRLSKLIQNLRNSEQENDVLNFNVILVPLKGTNSPKMEKPYVSCCPSVLISHLRHLVAFQTSCLAEQVEIYMKKNSFKDSSGLLILAGEKSLREILPIELLEQGELELLYAVKSDV